jgi:hypothetical protein
VQSIVDRLRWAVCWQGTRGPMTIGDIWTGKDIVIAGTSKDP